MGVEKRGRTAAKGQITVFVVVGLLLVIAGLLIYSSKTGFFEPKSSFSEEAEPVAKLIESCTSSVGKQAIILMGQQGGYIEIPESLMDENLHINLGLIKIPYWHTRGRENIPPITGPNSMEEALEKEINANIGECINNFSSAQGFSVKELTIPQADVTISQKDVTIVLNYELDVYQESGDKASRISRIVVKLPVALKEAYDLATEIMKKENSEAVFENITIDLVSLNPRIPFTNIEFKCEPQQWQLKDIREEMINTIYYNLPKIRFKNTNYTSFIEPEAEYEKLREYTQEDVFNGKIPEHTPDDAYDYFHYTLSTQSKYERLKAGVIYRPEFGLNVVASPSDNGILKANYGEGTEKYLQYLCINVYHFVYDIVYPAQITIFDPESFNGEGYSFNFAFPVQIKSNEPNRNVYIPTIFEQPVPYTGYCDSLSEQKYDIRAVGDVPLIDTKLPLSDVNITYNCLKFQCKLGTTKPDSSCGNCRRLYTGLPTSGQHCFLQASKEGYVEQEVQVLNDYDITFDLRKEKEFKLNVMKKVGAVIEELEPYESALIQVEDTESKFVSYAEFLKNEARTIKLIEGKAKYNVSIMFFDLRNDRFLGGYKGEWEADASGRSEVTFKVLEIRPTPISAEEQYQALNYLQTNKANIQDLQPELS